MIPIPAFCHRPASGAPVAFRLSFVIDYSLLRVSMQVVEMAESLRASDGSRSHAHYLLGWLYAGLQFVGVAQKVPRNDWLAYVHFLSVQEGVANNDAAQQIRVALAHAAKRLTPEAIAAAHAVVPSLGLYAGAQHAR